MVAVHSAASPGCSKCTDVGLLSVDVSGDDIQERIRPQNSATHVENGRYTELGSIDRLGRAVGIHVSLVWDGSGGGVSVRIAIVLVTSGVYLRV